ncbi:apoptosis facilitator Bcl-2-like protein 14 isoform 1-T2 [Mantella aurantiaca]
MVSVPEHTMEEVPLQEEDEDTIEYRMFVIYAQRSLSNSKYLALQRAISTQGGHTTTSNGKDEKTNAEEKKTEKQHKKKGWPKKLTPACLRPQKSKRKIVDGSLEKVKSPEEEKASNIVSQMQRIVQRKIKQEKKSGYRMVRRVSSIQQDGDDEDEIIANIVQILRAVGDKVNNQITEERTLMEKIKRLWSYDFYKKVTDCFLSETVPISDTEEEQQTTKIALCLHATTALTTLENQPMNKVLGFGARYLRENYSSWIQSRGGWENAMGIQSDEEEIE